MLLRRHCIPPPPTVSLESLESIVPVGDRPPPPVATNLPLGSFPSFCTYHKRVAVLIVGGVAVVTACSSCGIPFPTTIVCSLPVATLVVSTTIQLYHPTGLSQVVTVISQHHSIYPPPRQPQLDWRPIETNSLSSFLYQHCIRPFCTTTVSVLSCLVSHGLLLLSTDTQWYRSFHSTHP